MKHDLHISPHCPQALTFELGQLHALQGYAARSGTVQLQDASAHCGLAATRLSHQSECLAWVNVKRDILHSVHMADGFLEDDARGDGEALDEMLYAQQRLSPACRLMDPVGICGYLSLS
ncbi:MAG: hypothetical protein BWY79_01940 [Actinobacteria bacterium ADurb.Bin444]|nr:MAG: hypothetical protein BWY79_01940 [Actinobacteria bacterium ADurb.Bin444]